MGHKKISIFTISFVFALLLIPNVSSFAVPASDNPSGAPNLPQQETNNGIFGTDNVDVNNFWGIFGDIEFDPDAGPWIKQLNDFISPCPCAIEEFITIQGGVWTDWHERFVPGGIPPADLEWTSFTMSASFDGGNNFFAVPGLTVDLMPQDVWADFDPLLPGTVIHIQKEFNYIGNNPPSVPTPIFIEEFPSAIDYGDDPDAPYPTLLANDGARHQITGPRLGATEDSEADGQPTLNADGDDIAADDEDGIAFTSLLVKGQPATYTVSVSNAPGLLNAWIDFDQDGTFGAGLPEQIAIDIAVVIGNNFLGFSVPTDAKIDDTYSRFRIDTGGGLTPKGFALNGEVEDYKVKIAERDVPIGGTLIPIDTTSLLLVGAQMTAAWLIPVVVSAAGFGIILARKISNKNE